MAIFFEIKRDGRNFSVTADRAPAFPIGQRVRYKSKKTGVEFFGLSNDGGFFGSDYAATLKFNAGDFDSVYGFMAHFIEPTAICEGQSFISLNTYDRARFTFGFGQFAAHVPGGDFIRWFSDMLGRPEAVDYFPNLAVKNGAILKLEGGSESVLADASTTKALCDYFNPTLSDIEDSEVITAGKFCHWTLGHEGARLLQVQHMVNTALRLVRYADKRVDLDGRSADLCCVIFDILHQGRGGFDDMLDAMKSAKPFESLLKIGAISEPNRVTNLSKAMKTRRQALAARTWSRAKGEFV